MADVVDIEQFRKFEESERAKHKALANDVVTEDSAAVSFIEQHGRNIRFCHDTAAWFRWDGNIWRLDSTCLAYHWARQLARKLAEDQDAGSRKRIGKSAFASGVERFAQRDPAVAVTIDHWDRDLWLLGTPAGTIDLRAGKLRPADPKDGITKSVLVAPDDSAGCPLWLQFLSEATGADEGLVKFLQQWLGYCLTGVTIEQALIFLYGPGGNGKGVFLNIITRIMADYCAVSAMSTFEASKHERHPVDLAALRGARTVTASETEQGRAWAEARIKQLTGSDRISARFMGKNFFEYVPQFKLTIIGNHKPALRNVDDAIKRRFNIIPFVIKPKAVDHKLEEKLIAEAPAILAWMITGCLDWQANGLVRPKSVVDATNDYFDSQDLMAQWIEEKCDTRTSPPGAADMWDRTSHLFASWSDYCRAAGEEPGSEKAFSGDLEKRGFEKHRKPNGRGFKGVRLKYEKPSDGAPPF